MILNILRLILGSIFVLFIPGFAITLAIFPRALDPIERITLSFAFSITIVPLMILLLNQWLGAEGFPIDLLHSFMVGISITVLSILIWTVRRGK